MGVWDAITEIFEAAAPWGEAQAEAPAEEPQTQVGLTSGPRRNWGDGGRGQLACPRANRPGDPGGWTRNRDVFVWGEN